MCVYELVGDHPFHSKPHFQVLSAGKTCKFAILDDSQDFILHATAATVPPHYYQRANCHIANLLSRREGHFLPQEATLSSFRTHYSHFEAQLGSRLDNFSFDFFFYLAETRPITEAEMSSSHCDNLLLAPARSHPEDSNPHLLILGLSQQASAALTCQSSAGEQNPPSSKPRQRGFATDGLLTDKSDRAP